MRLGTKKLIYIRKSRESKRRFFAFFIILIIFLLLSFVGAYFLEILRPTMIELTKTRARQLSQQAINEAVLTIFADGNVSYKDVLVLEKNEDGSIAAAQSNLEGINKLKATLTTEIQSNIEKTDTAKISIPVGTLTGTDILAGIGPRLSVEFVPYGISEVDFVSKFEDSGINQTRLVINLEVKTTVGLLMPTVSTDVDVETTVPVIQTIIVGDVPNSYTNVERDGHEFEDDVLELAE